MSLHIQVRTRTGGIEQVLIWGNMGRMPQLVHLYSEIEETKKQASVLLPTLYGLYKYTGSGSSLHTSYRKDSGVD